MSTMTTVGPFTISVRAEHSPRFVTLYVGEILRDGVLVEKTAAVANYELARIAAVDEARARLTSDEERNFVAVALGYVADGQDSCKECFNPVGAHAGADEHLCAQCYAIKHGLPVPCNDCGQPCNEHIECQNEKCFLYVVPAATVDAAPKCRCGATLDDDGECPAEMAADQAAFDARNGYVAKLLPEAENDAQVATHRAAPEYTHHIAGTSKERARLAAEKIRSGSFDAWTDGPLADGTYEVITNAPDAVAIASIRSADAIA